MNTGMCIRLFLILAAVFAGLGASVVPAAESKAHRNHKAIKPQDAVIFSRDSLFIESTVKIPVTRPAAVVPSSDPAKTSASETVDAPTNTNAVTRGKTAPAADPAKPAPPAMVHEVIEARKKHQFFVTINNADAMEADWIVDLSEIRNDFGVLYVFNKPSPATIPPSESEQHYDILFIGSYGNILTIAEDIAAASLAEPIEVKTPVKALLYLAGGSVKKLGLSLNDRVLHPLFPKPPSITN